MDEEVLTACPESLLVHPREAIESLKDVDAMFCVECFVGLCPKRCVQVGRDCLALKLDGSRHSQPSSQEGGREGFVDVGRRLERTREKGGCAGRRD